jgi:hypothetical protein
LIELATKDEDKNREVVGVSKSEAKQVGVVVMVRLMCTGLPLLKSLGRTRRACAGCQLNKQACGRHQLAIRSRGAPVSDRCVPLRRGTVESDHTEHHLSIKSSYLVSAHHHHKKEPIITIPYKIVVPKRHKSNPGYPVTPPSITSIP